MSNHLFCFGLGSSAHQLARNLLAKGWRISGTHRTLDACEKERPYGITAHIFDEYLPLENIWDLQSVTHLLISIPPHKTMGDIVLQHHAQDLTQLPNLQWIGYLSTTGVYGDQQGEWVDEQTPASPCTDRAARRVSAELAWLNTGLPVHIFRLAGIYGTHCNSLVQLKEGTAKIIDKPNQYFSRIHIEDIATILEHSIARPNPSAIYNCADDHPCSSEEILTYAAQLVHAPLPTKIPLDQANLSPMAASFYQQSRRVKNDKIKNELGVVLKYPTYKEGLTACLAHI